MNELLNERNSSVIHAFGFIPGIIFRSKSVEKYIPFAYNYINTSYPHLYLLMKAFPVNAIVYTLQEPIIYRGTTEASGIGFEIYAYWWLEVAALPTSMSKRRAAQYLNCNFGFRWLIKSIYADIRQKRDSSEVLEKWKFVYDSVPIGRPKIYMVLLYVLTWIKYPWLKYLLKNVLHREFQEGTYMERNSR